MTTMPLLSVGAPVPALLPSILALLVSRYDSMLRSVRWRSGFGSQGFVASPGAVQQQVFVEGIPVREPPLPFCGVGVGWFL
jgi:hypothetical protein